jgi:hypothetical protein
MTSKAAYSAPAHRIYGPKDSSHFQSDTALSNGVSSFVEGQLECIRALSNISAAADI